MAEPGTRSAALLVMAVVLAGCSGAPASSTSPVVAATPDPGLGTMKGTADPSHAATIDFLADGKDVSGSLTDAAGARWTLKIPADALLLPQTITLTALNGVSATGRTVSDGVSFAPDGLRFIDPPTLSVTPPPGQTAVTLYTARGDGTGLVYAVAAGPGQARILDFSEAGADWGSPDLKSLQAELTAAENDARALLREGNPPRGPIPSWDGLACPVNGKEPSPPPDMQSQEAQWMQPETDLVRRILGDERSLQLAGSSVGIDDNGLVSKLAFRVRDRLIQEINRLIGAPDHSPNQMIPFIQMALGVTRQLLLLGVTADDVPEQVTKWVRLVMQDQVTKLKQHDYDAFRRGVILARDYALLSGDRNDSTWQELFALLRFKVEVTYDITGPSNLQEEAKVTGTAKWDSQTPDVETDPSASGQYSSGSITVPNEGDATKDTPDGWSTNLLVSTPLTCDGVIGLAMAPWGKPDTEHWHFKGQDISAYVGANHTLTECVGLAFQASIQENVTLYHRAMITSQLHNKDAVAADDTHTGSCPGGNTISLHIHIQHAG